MTSKLFVTAALTLCAAIYVTELSGRWDQTLRDANDEAGFVAIVLCVGAALGSMVAFVARIMPSRQKRVRDELFVAFSSFPQVFFLPAAVDTGPPLILRI